MRDRLNNKKNVSEKKQTIAFYDALSNNYDSILSQTSSNKTVRQKVKEKFCNTVKGEYVLDFGGGTGLDMGWLIDNNYQVIFCEPSEGMKQQAIQYNNEVLHSNIVFLEGAKTDFTTWNQELPFSETVDAVLSNFAAINNISDIELLFNNLALILKPGGHIIALILEYDFKKLFKSNLFDAITSFILKEPVASNIKYKEYYQTVYLHSIKQLKRASNKYFIFCEHESLTEFGFALIHLIRK